MPLKNISDIYVDFFASSREAARIRRFRWYRLARLFRGEDNDWLLLPLEPTRGKANLASRAAPSKSLRASSRSSAKLSNPVTPKATDSLPFRPYVYRGGHEVFTLHAERVNRQGKDAQIVHIKRCVPGSRPKADIAKRSAGRWANRRRLFDKACKICR